MIDPASLSAGALFAVSAYFLGLSAVTRTRLEAAHLARVEAAERAAWRCKAHPDCKMCSGDGSKLFTLEDKAWWRSPRYVEVRSNCYCVDGRPIGLQLPAGSSKRDWIEGARVVQKAAKRRGGMYGLTGGFAAGYEAGRQRAVAARRPARRPTQRWWRPSDSRRRLPTPAEQVAEAVVYGRPNGVCAASTTGCRHQEETGDWACGSVCELVVPAGSDAPTRNADIKAAFEFTAALRRKS